MSAQSTHKRTFYLSASLDPFPSWIAKWREEKIILKKCYERNPFKSNHAKAISTHQQIICLLLCQVHLLFKMGRWEEGEGVWGVTDEPLYAEANIMLLLILHIRQLLLQHPPFIHTDTVHSMWKNSTVCFTILKR